MHAEVPLASRNADGQTRLGSGALRRNFERGSRQVWLATQFLKRLTMMTPPPTLPSLHHVESRPRSLATQSVTLLSSSVQAGEQSQLNLLTLVV